MSLESKLSSAQSKAIIMGMKTGMQIAKEYPQIADDYRNLMTQLEIAEKYGFMDVYKIKNRRTMKTSMHYALEILIPSKIRKEIEEKIRKKAGEDRYKNGNGVGAFNRKKQKKTGRNSAIKRGYIPWSHEQKMTLLELVENPGYQHPEESCLAGKPDYNLIQSRMHQLYGVRRTINTLYNRVNKLKKNKDNSN